MPLSQALDSNNQEMKKRLKYTKDILTHMLNNNGGTLPATGPATAKNAQVTNSMRGSAIPGMTGPLTVNSRQSDARLVSASSLDRKGFTTPASIPKF